mgnify:CR=1 FL=1
MRRDDRSDELVSSSDYCVCQNVCKCSHISIYNPDIPIYNHNLNSKIQDTYKNFNLDNTNVIKTKNCVGIKKKKK